MLWFGGIMLALISIKTQQLDFADRPLTEITFHSDTGMIWLSNQQQLQQQQHCCAFGLIIMMNHFLHESLF